MPVTNQEQKDIEKATEVIIEAFRKAIMNNVQDEEKVSLIFQEAGVNMIEGLIVHLKESIASKKQAAESNDRPAGSLDNVSFLKDFFK